MKAMAKTKIEAEAPADLAIQPGGGNVVAVAEADVPLGNVHNVPLGLQAAEALCSILGEGLQLLWPAEVWLYKQVKRLTAY